MVKRSYLSLAITLFIGALIGTVATLVASSDQPAATPVSIERPAALLDLLNQYQADTRAVAPASWPELCTINHHPTNLANIRVFCAPGVLTVPSATPTTPQSTPPPTNTPRATATSTPTRTATAEIEPSETQEHGIPTDEPTVDGGDKSTCEAKVQEQSHSLRSDHNTASTHLVWVPKSVVVSVQAIYIIEPGSNEWIKTSYSGKTGWMWIGSNLRYEDDTLEVCLDPDMTPTTYASTPKTPVPTQAGPTPTKLPDVPIGCEVINNTSGNLNVRNGPGLSNAVIGSLRPGQTGQAITDYVNGQERWVRFSQLSDGGQNFYGWVAMFIPAQGNLASVQGDCSQLPRKTALLTGWHLTQGARWEPLANTAGDYGAVKSTDLTKDIAATFKQENPDALWVHRSIFGSGGAFNCPTFEWTSPAVWVERYRYTWPTAAQYVELINECQTGPGGATFSNFVIESTKYANSLGFCVLVFSFASGTPDYPEWITLVPILKWLDANPCKVVNGKPVYNGVALHGAFCSGPGMMSNEWTREPHICDRHVFIRDVLLANTGYDLLNFRGPIVYTELGIDAGYGGTSADPVWPTDKWLQVVNHTLDLFEQEGIIDALLLWNLGDGGAGQWTSREYWIEPLAALLRSRQ